MWLNKTKNKESNKNLIKYIILFKWLELKIWYYEYINSDIKREREFSVTQFVYCVVNYNQVLD